MGRKRQGTSGDDGKPFPPRFGKKKAEKDSKKWKTPPPKTEKQRESQKGPPFLPFQSLPKSGVMNFDDYNKRRNLMRKKGSRRA